jgi:hypothetical protein
MSEADGRLFVDVTEGLASPASRDGLLEPSANPPDCSAEREDRRPGHHQRQTDGAGTGQSPASESAGLILRPPQELRRVLRINETAANGVQEQVIAPEDETPPDPGGHPRSGEFQG